MITWFSKDELKPGDSFTVTIVDVPKNSKTIETRSLTQSKEEANEQKLKHYNVLKKEVEELGLNQLPRGKPTRYSTETSLNRFRCRTSGNKTHLMGFNTQVSTGCSRSNTIY